MLSMVLPKDREKYAMQVRMEFARQTYNDLFRVVSQCRELAQYWKTSASMSTKRRQQRWRWRPNRPWGTSASRGRTRPSRSYNPPLLSKGTRSPDTQNKLRRTRRGTTS